MREEYILAETVAERKRRKRQERNRIIKEENKRAEELRKVELVKSLKDDWRGAIIGIIVLFGIFFLLNLVSTALASGVTSLIIAYTAISVLNISAEVNAIKVRFDGIVEGKIYSGGIYIFWKWIDKAIIYPTEVVQINPGPQNVNTKKKIIKDETSGVSEVFETAKVPVNAVFAFNWPTTFAGMKAAYLAAPDPSEKEEVAALFEPFFGGALRDCLGRYAWGEMTGTMRRLAVQVKNVILGIADNDTDITDDDLEEDDPSVFNPIQKSGITQLSVKIEDVNIPEEFLKGMAKKQTSHYEAAATVTEAKAKREALILEGEGKARARNDSLAVMREYPDEAPLYTLEETSKGPASTIIFSAPELTRALNKISGDEGKSNIKPLNMDKLKKSKDILKRIQGDKK